MEESFAINILIWLGIGFCITQSAMFSGLNLAIFSVSRLRLEVEVEGGNPNAKKVLALRKDSNFALTTILWGNVSINVLLTLLSDSVLAGISAFFFSTVVITLVGEIFPQAYFSRQALRIASMLSPVLRFYQILLYPVAKPIAKVLDWWLGPEGVHYFRERELREVIKKHMEADEAEVTRFEGIGVLNFLAIGDLTLAQEGEPVHSQSVIQLPVTINLPVFPKFELSPGDAFLQQIQASGKKWVIIIDLAGEPHIVLDSDGFLRGALFSSATFNPYVYCHRPIVVTDDNVPLGEVIPQLKVHPETHEDDVIDHDIILVWGTEKRVITGADILGRLLRGIAIHESRHQQ
jgi:metal transporter CNNM